MTSDFFDRDAPRAGDPGGVPFAGSGDASSDGSDLPTRFRRHASSIERAGRSPLSVALMRGAADDIEAGGYLAELLDGVPLPAGQAPALRVLAALHRLVLEDRAPELSPFYPTVGGTNASSGAWQAAEKVLRSNAREVRPALLRGVQTNEPGRSAVLFGVLLWVVERFGTPVRLFEIGASAGLNLLAPDFGYKVCDLTLGDAKSALIFEDPWVSSPVKDPAGAAERLEILERRGCDLAPIDASSPEGRLTLLSYIWPDEPGRIARMRAALAVAAVHRPVVDTEAADSWLERVLEDGRGRGVTVVWQSVVAQYLEPETRSRIDDAVEQSGRRATDKNPLVYARMEPGIHADRGFGVLVTYWPGGEPPGGESMVLAVAGDHGPPVRWAD
jgi:hypothetical protein